MYIAIRNTKHKGVYLDNDDNKKMLIAGVSYRLFSEDELEKALKWACVKNVTLPFNVKNFMKKYRACKDINKKIKMISKLSEYNASLVKKNMTKKEIADYKKHASALIERRYNCIKRHKKCLDAVTSDNPDLKLIKEKYINVDLSIPIYTIKAIINVHDGIGFSTDDYKYSKNAEKYYDICVKYWEKIIYKWDTDTGVLSKEDIENRNFSEYHINANKVKTILPQLKKGRRNIRRYR